jgi:hypothetical protein
MDRIRQTDTESGERKPNCFVAEVPVHVLFRHLFTPLFEVTQDADRVRLDDGRLVRGAGGSSHPFRVTRSSDRREMKRQGRRETDLCLEDLFPPCSRPVPLLVAPLAAASRTKRVGPEGHVSARWSAVVGSSGPSPSSPGIVANARGTGGLDSATSAARAGIVGGEVRGSTAMKQGRS